MKLKRVAAILLSGVLSISSFSFQGIDSYAKADDRSVTVIETDNATYAEEPKIAEEDASKEDISKDVVIEDAAEDTIPGPEIELTKNGSDAVSDKASENSDETALDRVDADYAASGTLDKNKNISWTLTDDGILTISGVGAIDYKAQSQILCDG